MNMPQEQIPFKIEITADGSPTLRLGNGGESMHHSGGAATETCYIYQSVMEQAYRVLPGSSTCVVGLGLGYIELCWALTVLSQASPESSLTSFEINEGLRADFNGWLEANTALESEKHKLYGEVFNSLQRVLKFPIEDAFVRQKLRENFKKYPLQSDLRQSLSKPKEAWNIVCYDAFSSKTNTELWTESFLQEFLNHCCAPDCVFTTYACTGNLKKTLSSSGFEVIKRPGFQGKRDSTLAFRGVFKQGLPPNSCRIF